jgi:hypothetical protein
VVCGREAARRASRPLRSTFTALVRPSAAAGRRIRSICGDCGRKSKRTTAARAEMNMNKALDGPPPPLMSASDSIRDFAPAPPAPGVAPGVAVIPGMSQRIGAAKSAKRMSAAALESGGASVEIEMAAAQPSSRVA